MLCRMTAEELGRWRAYERIEPFGENRADLRMAISTASLVNKGRGRGAPKVKAADFMPNFDGHRHQTPEEMQQKIRGRL